MPFLHEFGPDDIFYNRLQTAPQYEFVAYSGSLYFNNGKPTANNFVTGTVSLSELNVDRTPISGADENRSATGSMTLLDISAASVNSGTIVIEDEGGHKVVFQYDDNYVADRPIKYLGDETISSSNLVQGYGATAWYKIGCKYGYTTDEDHAIAVFNAISTANGTRFATQFSDLPSVAASLDAGRKIPDLAIDVHRHGNVLSLTQSRGRYAMQNAFASNAGILGNTPILIANSSSGCHLTLSASSVGFGGGAAKTSIHSFTVKDGNMSSFKSIATGTYSEADYGTLLTGALPLTSSIDRNYIYGGRVLPYRKLSVDGEGVTDTDDPGLHSTDTYFSQSRPVLALRNIIDKYRIQSPAFTFSGSKTADPTIPPYLTGAINLISIPAIFYGSQIEKGSVDLKFYYTGSLLDQAKDEKRNGELISTKSGSSVSGSTVGVVLYDEGFILLYNERTIDSGAIDSYTGTGSSGAGLGFQANWTYFMSYLTGSSGSQGLKAGTAPGDPPPAGHMAGFDHAPGGATRTDANYGYYPSASHFSLSFRGKNIVPTITMFANAPFGSLNNSQNPTWISSSNSSWKEQIHFDSSSYIEPHLMKIKNTVQSEFCNYEDDFQKQTFISKVGIYDKDKNLLGIAKLATPVLKKETDSYTFKLKLDL